MPWSSSPRLASGATRYGLLASQVLPGDGRFFDQVRLLMLQSRRTSATPSSGSSQVPRLPCRPAARRRPAGVDEDVDGDEDGAEAEEIEIAMVPPQALRLWISKPCANSSGFAGSNTAPSNSFSGLLLRPPC